MARISTYNLDNKVTGGDKWIGTDEGFYNKTKNFTPLKLAEYFNASESVRSSNSLMFTYQTLDIGESRSFGTISFKEEVGPQVEYSDISQLLINKKSKSTTWVSEFLLSLSNSKIIIHKFDDINNFGIYNVTSVTEDYDETDFLVFNLVFIQGNNFIEEDEDYFLSIIDYDLNSNSDKTYIYTQNTASISWSVNHNLQKFPSVSVVLPTNQKGYGDVNYIDENNLTITFAGAESGKAYIN